MNRDAPRLRLAGAMLGVALVAVVVVVLTDPFGGRQKPSGVSDNASPTSLATVTRGSLSSHVQVAGTLGYTGHYSIVNQSSGMLTALPHVADVVRRGRSIYRVNGKPVILLYGRAPAYRTLVQGSSGRDVAALNANLVALGYATRAQIDPGSQWFTSATAHALRALQAGLGVPQTGSLALGDAIFLPAALRITAVPATLAAPAPPGGVVAQATSLKRRVTVAISAAQQSRVRIGGRVAITLADDRITGGVVTGVSTVATPPPSSSGGSGGGGATVEVKIRPTRPAATGRLDQEPVYVAITTAHVRRALAVPVHALLARGGGGYGVEIVDAHRTHRIVGVTLGVFADAEGLVQVSGRGLTAGQRVVVPAE